MKIQNYNNKKSHPEGNLSKPVVYIKEVKNSNYSEVKFEWEDRKREPRMYLRDQPTVGSHFKGNQGQQKFKNWEGKGEKSPSFERKTSICFGCGEQGHFKAQCVKNRDFGQQRGKLNLPKEVDCVEQKEAPIRAVEVGAIATTVSAGAESPDQQEHREVSLLRKSEDEVKQVNFVHTKSKGNRETPCYPEIVKLKTLEGSKLKPAELVRI